MPKYFIKKMVISGLIALPGLILAVVSAYYSVQYTWLYWGEILGLLIVVAAGVYNTLHFICPYCHAYLGKRWPSSPYCQSCGKDIFQFDYSQLSKRRTKKDKGPPTSK